MRPRIILWRRKHAEPNVQRVPNPQILPQPPNVGHGRGSEEMHSGIRLSRKYEPLPLNGRDMSTRILLSRGFRISIMSIRHLQPNLRCKRARRLPPSPSRPLQRRTGCLHILEQTLSSRLLLPRGVHKPNRQPMPQREIQEHHPGSPAQPLRPLQIRALLRIRGHKCSPGVHSGVFLSHRLHSA